MPNRALFYAACTGVSSNGRTLVFGTSYLGSNPGTPAILFLLRLSGIGLRTSRDEPSAAFFPLPLRAINLHSVCRVL